MRISIETIAAGLRPSRTRIPFRYGKACLTHCPQAIVAVTIRTDGRRQTGYGGDCLPPGWFDKRPDRSFARQIDQMLNLFGSACDQFRDAFARPAPFVPTWLECLQGVHAEADRHDATPLLASFAVSLIERAAIDAICRATSTPFSRLIREDHLRLDAGRVHHELAGTRPGDWLPASPLNEVWVRHTIGMADPLTTQDLDRDPSLKEIDDGLPVTLEDHLQRSGIRFLKVKVANRLEDDMDRLRVVARLAEQYRGEDYAVTLDGNEQYSELSMLGELIERMKSDVLLSRFWQRVLLIEQPLERSGALEEASAEPLAALGVDKPIIIDESDSRLDSFRRALEIGYRGTSVKNCKGPLKSVLNAGLVWAANRRREPGYCILTSEDLCSVGIVPVQADLCLVATLGIEHSERNGHHFHPGLSYLPPSVQQAALEGHPDFYRRFPRFVGPVVENGRMQIGSLHRAGFGFDCLPDLADYVPIESWHVGMLESS